MIDESCRHIKSASRFCTLLQIRQNKLGGLQVAHSDTREPRKSRTVSYRQIDFLINRPKHSKVASLGRRLHRLGHRNVTHPLKTRWLTPAGLCISTRKFGAFASCQTSLVAKPRDAFDTHRHPKRFKLGSKAQNHGTTPKPVPCSETLQKRHFRVFVPPRGFGEKRQWQWHEKPDHRVPMCLEAKL